MLPLALRAVDRIIDEVIAALDAQTAVISGTADSGRVLAGVTRALDGTLTERRALATALENRLDAYRLARVLTCCCCTATLPTPKSSTPSGPWSR